MEQLREKINADRKVKPITIDGYLRNIRMLANATTGQDFDGNIDFLKDITAIKLENLSCEYISRRRGRRFR